LGKRSQQIKRESLSRLLIYILGHRPDEFGLLPDRDGFVGIKELLQALHEESGWGYVRRSHLNEILLGAERDSFECRGDRMRTLERRWQWELGRPVEDPPKVLLAPIRRRAHPVVLERGLSPGKGEYLVLSPDRQMAERIGKRRDPDPVLIEVASEQGTFYRFGVLFLSSRIPGALISGPPLSKAEEKRRAEKEAEKAKAGAKPKSKPSLFEPGTFRLDPDRMGPGKRKGKGQKPKGWKEKARKVRRTKRQ